MRESAQSTRSPSLPQPQIAHRFWSLVGPPPITHEDDPEEVVRHLMVILESLGGRSAYRSTPVDALPLLLHLEHDPAYAAPEQLDHGARDSRSLVYSVGVLLYERLTGQLPFGDTLHPSSPTLGGIPFALRRVMLRALSPTPGPRQRNVGALHDELALYLGRADTVVAPLASRRELGSHPPSPIPIARGSGPMARPARVTPPPCPGSDDRALYDLVVGARPRSQTAVTVIRDNPLWAATHADVPGRRLFPRLAGAMLAVALVGAAVGWFVWPL